MAVHDITQNDRLNQTQPSQQILQRQAQAVEKEAPVKRVEDQVEISREGQQLNATLEAREPEEAPEEAPLIQGQETEGNQGERSVDLLI